jgi:hypothetical protein
MRPQSGSASETASVKNACSKGSTPVHNEHGDPPLDKLMNIVLLGLGHSGLDPLGVAGMAMNQFLLKITPLQARCHGARSIKAQLTDGL